MKVINRSQDWEKMLAKNNYFGWKSLFLYFCLELINRNLVNSETTNSFEANGKNNHGNWYEANPRGAK
jgi:hypothetical protein